MATNINYDLIRSRRKTLALHITRDGRLEVRAPLRISVREINQFVLSKRGWIEKHLTEVSDRLEHSAAFTLSFGDRVPLLGETCEIVPVPGKKAGYREGAFLVPEDTGAEMIRRYAVAIYKMFAGRIIRKKVADFAKIMQVAPASVRIGAARSRWGSCNAAGRLNFSWFIVMGDEALVDYLVVHELAHLIHLNHSAAFWDVVGRYIADPKDCRRRLKKLHEQISSENWE